MVDAVLELDRSHGGTLAIGKLMEARVETGAQPGLTLVVMQGSGSAAAAVQKHYTLPAVAAAVIHYCFRARIPLPRQATKSMEVVPEGFQLTIQTRHRSAAPAWRGAAGVAGGSGGPAATPDAVVATGDAALDDPTNPEVRRSDRGCVA